MSDSALLRTRSLVKSYGGVQALQGADLDVYPGEVHALLGENGTGKSTLMRILAGVESPDSGEIHFAGEPVTFRSAAQARDSGVGIVFQELSLFPDLDVLANLFVGREQTKRGRVMRKAMATRALPVAERLGFSFSLETKVANLTLAERQLVEIAKALLSEARLLILDEPNSALNSSESARLFKLIGDLRLAGAAVIYISHRLEEVFALADRISVMRGGRVVATDRADNLNIPAVVSAMLGRDVAGSSTRSETVRRAGPVSLRLVEVDVGTRVHDVSFEAHPGDVVGLVGLEGAGQQDVLRAVFGGFPVTSGHMELDGSAWKPRTPRDAARAGVAFVPADRTREGLMMERSIGDNVAHVRMATSAGRLYRSRDLVRRADRHVDDLGIKTTSALLPANSLSGGNQQKVVLAKWLEISPKFLLLDDPTRGVDVGGKAEIYELVTQLAKSGVTVLFTSSEFIEYQLVCDRVLVFFSSQLVEEIEINRATEHVLAEAVNTRRTAAPTSAEPAPSERPTRPAHTRSSQ